MNYINVDISLHSIAIKKLFSTSYIRVIHQVVIDK